MRHAKSSWADAGTRDHDRVLNKRGLRNAPAMGEFLLEQQVVPELVISSSAERATQTAELVIGKIAEATGNSISLEVDSRLYLGAPQHWVSRVPVHCDDQQCVMIVGHNPGLEQLIAELTGQYVSMPTAAIALVQLPIDDWNELGSAEQGELTNVWRPKEVGIEAA